MSSGATAPHRLSFRLLPEDLALCRLAPGAAPPPWATGSGFWSVTRTDRELSLVCPARRVPRDVEHSAGWRALGIEGHLPLEMIGVLAQVAACLAGAGISCLALATYETDYFLVQGRDLARARQALTAAGHRLPLMEDL